MFPEVLYRLSGADVGSQWLNIVIRRGTTSTAGTTVNAEIQVPDNDVWLLTNVFIRANPGAAQGVTDIALSIVVSTSTVARIAGDNRPGTADLTEDFDRQFSGLMIKGPCIIRGTGVYDAGVAANQTDVYVMGLAIPRGNFNQT